MRYRVICGILDELMDAVNAAIIDGWTPQGGVVYWGENENDQHIQYGYSLFAQAMVKTSVDSTKPGTEISGSPGEKLEGYNTNDQ